VIQSYVDRDGKLGQTNDSVPPRHLADAVWVDVVSPDADELALVAAGTRLSLPSEADLLEIESSSRLSAVPSPTGDVLTLSMPLVQMTPDGGRAVPLGVVLSPERLITIRFAPSQVFQNFATRQREPAEPRSADILIGLLEAIVDRQADALEGMRGEIDRLSHRIFHLKLSPEGERAGAKRREQESELREMVSALGRLYDSVSLVRDSQLGIARIVPYVAATAGWLPKTMTARLKVIARDVGSLNEFITHMTDKVQFVLDATLGLINIAQNDLMKVLTIVSVIGIPPTLIAGIYGMNFVNIPELHWHFGYAYGLGLILLTGIAPLLWFRRKGWL